MCLLFVSVKFNTKDRETEEQREKGEDAKRKG